MQTGSLFIKRLLQVSISLFLLAPSLTKGQAYDPLTPPNTFRNADNANYWKNRTPIPGYWQQDVHYKIKANIDEQTDILTGKEELTYWNNSPDTLHYVYFHLYQNAFQPGSHYHNLQKNNKRSPFFGNHESQGKGTEVKNLTVNEKTVETQLDNTILKVILPEPLAPNENIVFKMDFKTFFDQGSLRRRMKMFKHHGVTHYDGVHWYPRISVYDRKFGWTTDQHLSKEFYGDFGTFDVELTFASNYIVGATGNLLNRKEVLPEQLRKKLDVKNFQDKPKGESPSEIIPYNSTEHKTWRYHAENVHDFAFTADPAYRIGKAETKKGVKCYSLVQEQNAAGWQNAAEYAARTIEVFSHDIGPYGYHKMIVADARDGMEYPMLTLDGGSDPGYRGLFVHEIGHNWFQGMVGTNETYRAAMDEGFTQFLTAWGLKEIDGDTLVEKKPSTSYEEKFREPKTPHAHEVYYGYLSKAIRKQGSRLNKHSDDFEGTLGHGGGYRQVYYKMGTMLYNLEYVLGDSLFQSAIQNYFDQWKFAHPYFEDFKNSVIRHTGVDLNWFFDQWWHGEKRIDYKVKRVRKGEGENEYEIRLKRKEDMQMPIDLSVVSKSDSIHHFHIPNTWFVKQTDAEVLPKWTGWGKKLHPEYKATVTIPDGIKKVEIDPSGRLADIYRLDNSTDPNIDVEFDHRMLTYSDHEEYEVFARPAIWYNGYDGMKAGAHLNGNYMKYKHDFDLTIWMNTGLLQNLSSERQDNAHMPLSYLFNYKTGLERFQKGLSLDFTSRFLDGLSAYQGGFVQKFSNERTSFSAHFKSMYRGGWTHFSNYPEISAHNYLLYPSSWSHKQLNNSLNLSLDHRYRYEKGKGHLNLDLRTPAPASDHDFSRISLTSINNTYTGFLEWRTRFFLQYGTGNNIPLESALYMAGGNPESMMDDPFTRSAGFFPQDWTGYGVETNHFQYGGGLNLRGYAGYLSPEEDEQDSVRYTFRGTSGASVNVEMGFHRLIGWDPFHLSKVLRFRPYLFGDAGTINYNSPDEPLAFTDIRVDAGIGATLTLHRIGPIRKFDPITLRLDMPFFLNRIPAVADNYFAPRWVIGIGKSF